MPVLPRLLTSIVLQKRTNEYRLHKLFGPAYNQKYASLDQAITWCWHSNEENGRLVRGQRAESFMKSCRYAQTIKNTFL